MFEKVEWSVQKLLSWAGHKSKQDTKEQENMKIMKKGSAMRVIFFYPGEEGTYVDNANVTLYENGIVHIFSNQEETTTHLQNCEILWRFETDAEERVNKVRLLKPKTDIRSPEENSLKAEAKTEIKAAKTHSSKNPELLD